jgi:hypothetical protein
MVLPSMQLISPNSPTAQQHPNHLLQKRKTHPSTQRTNVSTNTQILTKMNHQKNPKDSVPS